jgi:hypothetical protein
MKHSKDLKKNVSSTERISKFPVYCIQKYAMGSNPINLAIRFLLEMIALFSTGIWGWNQNEGWPRLLFALGIPLIFATIWGTFTVPNDPSRSSKALIVTPGVVRLAIELLFFSLASVALYDIGWYKASLGFGTLVIIHYVVSYDRIIWLLSNK